MYEKFMATVFSFDMLHKLVRILFIVSASLIFTSFLTRLIERLKTDMISKHTRFLIAYSIWYAGIALLTITILAEFGFHVGTILGAAGIAGAALGFASQTSLSNVISGLFLLTEHSFGVGDIIIVSGITGTVITINLLSVKLRKSDGTLVRIPNEQVIKSSVVNLSYFDERRFDFHVMVAYKENIKQVTHILEKIITENPYSMPDKKPFIMCDDLKDSGVSIFIGVWTKKHNFVNLKCSILADIKSGLENANVELPFPQIEVSIKDNKTL